MSDHDPSSSTANPFEDPIAAGHPLDILINAISGSDGYQIPQEAREGEFNLEQLLNGGDANDVVAHNQKGKRKREEVPLDARQAKVAKTVTSHIVQATASQPDPTKVGRARSQRYTPSTFSTIEVWHPTAGQKSYAKERRMLNPPPILRVTGPLLPLLTKATIRTVFTSDNAEASTSLSAQTQRIPLVPQLPPSPRPIPGAKAKRLEKEEAKAKLREQASRSGFGQTLPFERLKMAQKERDALSEGLSFPGLWVADGIGRNKEFRLELDLGQPGTEEMEIAAAKSSTSALQAETQAYIDPQIDAILQHAEAGPSDNSQRDLPESAIADDGGDIAASAVPEDASHELEAPQQLVSTAAPVGSSVDHIVNEAGPPASPTAGPSSSRDRSWARFVSSPLAVVSKPSQKTAKARSMASCLTVDDSFALWVRIHGQTVRTKYMKVDASDDASLTTRTGQWTPFRFEVLDRAAPSVSLDRTAGGRKRSVVHSTNILTYGSIGSLVDLQTGIKTEPMRLVRIDKNENLVGTDVGDPVSDLQRVGFVRLVDWQDDYTGGSRWYLSAPGARLGGAELHAKTAVPSQMEEALEDQTQAVVDPDPQTLGDVKDPPKGKGKAKKVKTKRFALAQAVIAEDAGGAEFALNWVKADRAEGERARGFGKEAIRRVEMCEKVEDWMCWILGGVASFSYSFFDGEDGSGGVPEGPVDPVPRPLLAPTFRPEANTLELTMSDFFSNDAFGRAQKYEVYLGPIGPLHTTTYRSTAPAESATDTAAKVDGDGPQWEAVPYLDDGSQGETQHFSVRSNYPCNLPHVIAVVAMPRAEEIIRTMQECFAEAQYQATSTLHALPGEPTEAEGWLPTRDAQASSVAIADDTLPAHAADPDNGADGTNPPVEPEPPTTGEAAPQAELDLHQMFQQQEGNTAQHDMDDITSVLAAQATETDFSLAHLEDQFLTSNLDPTLHALDTETGPPPPAPEAERDHDLGENATAAAEIAVAPSPHQQAQTTEEAAPAEQATSPSPPPPPPPSLTLSRPGQESKKIEMVPLPLVIVRQSDGVGFGLGRSVVAERVDSKNAADKPRWGLRVVAD